MAGDDLGMIAESVILKGTLRAFSNTSFYQLMERIEQVIIFFLSCCMINHVRLLCNYWILMDPWHWGITTIFIQIIMAEVSL